MVRNAKYLAGIALFLVVVCANVSRAGDKEDIVGRWDFRGSLGPNYLQFYADGTYKQVGLFTSEGKYTILPTGIIEFDDPGVFYGRNKSKVNYRIKDDYLDLDGGGLGLKLVRAK